MTRGKGSRLPLLLLPALLLVVACGVPISAQEITATAESKQAIEQLNLIEGSTVSSRASDAASQDSRLAVALTPASLSTIEALATTTPDPSATPGASTTPRASETPEPSTTPGLTVTPGATTLLASDTPDATGTPSATPDPDTTPTAQPTVSAPTSGMGAEVVNLVNEYRLANGLSRLQADPYITSASNSYARQMAESNSFGHVGPDGSSSEGRLAAAGYPGCFWGENIAAGQTSAAAAFNTWKASASHNSIMLAPDAVEIGVGYYYEAGTHYGHYWVLMTGRPEVGCVIG